MAKVKEKTCSNCICYYLNQEEGSEVYKAMEDAQIECSNEQEEVFTHNEKGTCSCWQEDKKRKE